MNCNNCTNNNALKEVKIKHVHGNVLRMAIPLTLRSIELVDGEINATDTPFVPSSEHPVKVVFSKGSVSVALDATMKDGNIAYIEEKGKIPVGTYAITVTCNDDNGNPYRFKQNAVLYVADATIEAGIEETIEYEVTTWYLDAAIFLALKGEDGVGIDDIETQSSGEIGGVNTVTFILTDGRTRSFTILNGSGAVDSDLDIDSPSPIANSAVTAKFNELSGELADLFGDVDYDSSSKTIRFWDKGKTNVLASLDARPFIKDGMVSNAYISNNTLVITFNTDSGKEAIGVPLTSVFNPNNYYTKTQVDSRIASAVANINLSNYYTKAQVDEKVSAKADITEVLTKGEHLGTDGKLKSEYATQLVLYYMGEPYDEGITTTIQPFQPIYENGYITYAISGSTSYSLGQPQSHIVYCNAKTNKLYRWNGSEFVQVGGSGSGSGGYEPPVGGIPKTDLASDVQTSLGKADTALQSSDLDGYATTDDVDDAVAALVSSAPQTLDTLKELADALGDDPNFATTMATQLGNKVDKETGKGLSTNDYTTAEKTKLAGLENYDDSALQTAIDGKVDKESGKSLMTDAERTKLQGIAAGAEVNVQPNWTQTNTSADDYIKNKPTLATVATSGSYNDLSNKPTIPTAQVNSDWNATTGKAAILNKPTIPVGIANATTSEDGTWTMTLSNGEYITIDLNHEHPQYVESDDLADVATTGSYNDLTDKPTIPAAYDDTTLSGRVSALENAGFITTETDPTVPSWAKQSSKPTYTAQEVGALPATTTIPTKVSDLTNDSGFITGYTETDPTVPAWAKASTKPTYTAQEVGALPSSTTIPSDLGDLTNNAGYTKNTGTITGITMNGASKGTSGVVDLGTVVTDVSGKANTSEMAVSTSGDQTTITLKTGTSATVINQHQSLSGYAKYLLISEADYTALVTKDSGTLYLIPES